MDLYTSTPASDVTPEQYLPYHGCHADLKCPDRRAPGPDGDTVYGPTYEQDCWGQQSGDYQQTEFDYGERGEIEGATEEDMQYQNLQQRHAQYVDSHPYGYHGTEYEPIGYHGNYPSYEHGEHKSAFHQVGVGRSQEEGQAAYAMTATEKDAWVQWNSPGQLTSVGPTGSPVKVQHGQGLENYRVTYQAAGAAEDRGGTQNTGAKEVPQTEMESLQQDFLNQGQSWDTAMDFCYSGTDETVIC